MTVTPVAKPKAPVKEETPSPAATVGTPSGYALNIEMFATRYKLGGRTTYSLDLTPAEIDGLVATPDPDVILPGNRRVIPAHAAGFAKYVRTRAAWIAPGILLRAPKSFKFTETAEIAGIQFGVVSFPRRSAVDLHIVDGQHRVLGWHMAIAGIAHDMDKARSALASARKVEKDGNAEKDIRKHIANLQLQLDRLEKERISVQVIVESDPKAFMQAFADISSNAKGISAAVLSRFDSTKVINRAFHLVTDHPLLKNRVNLESDRAAGQSPYLMGAKHVAEVIRAAYTGIDGRISGKQELVFKEKDLAASASRFFDILIEAFPVMKSVSLGQLTPEDLRKTSLLGSVIFVRALAGAYYDLIQNHAFTEGMVTEYFKKLAPHTNGPITSTGIWLNHVKDVFTEGGMAPHSRRQDIYILSSSIAIWAVDRADFVDAAPVDPPVVVEEVDPEFGKGYTDFGAVIPD